jgi:hypothetical protein
MCEPKEPRYFASDLVPGRAGPMSYSAYLNLFRNANQSHLAVGEASPTYLPSTVAVSNVLEFNPKARIIVLLRPQIEMVRSLHARSYLDGREDVADLEEAWNLQDARRTHRQIPKFCYEPKELLYGEFCRLGEQLEQVYHKVSRERILIIFSEEMRAQPRLVYEKVLSFLGIPSDNRQTFPRYEENRRRRWKALNQFLLAADRVKINLGLRSFGVGLANALDNMNEVKDKRGVLRPEFRKQLVEHFREDIAKLSQLTGKDLRNWLVP